MATFKEARLRAGYTQLQVADRIKTNPSLISNYESGSVLPSLEEMLLINALFDEVVEWPENIKPKKRHETVQAFIELSEKFPLETCFEYCARQFRRAQEPEKIIINTAEQITDEGCIPQSYLEK